MASDGKVPIIESAKAGWTFMQSSLGVVAPAAAIAAAISASSEAAADSANVPLMFVVLLAFIAINIAFSTFTLRLAVRQDASGFLGLQAGKDELNVAGAIAVVLFF